MTLASRRAQVQPQSRRSTCSGSATVPIALYRELADQGAAHAQLLLVLVATHVQFYLGRYYAQGVGVETDLDKKAACTLFRAVIAKGEKKYHFPALLLLARSLAADGLGDSQEALAARTSVSEVPVHKHPLVRRNASDVRSSDVRNLMCDICAATGVPESLWSCAECDYDECNDCHKE